MLKLLPRDKKSSNPDRTLFSGEGLSHFTSASAKYKFSSSLVGKVAEEHLTTPATQLTQTQHHCVENAVMPPRSKKNKDEEYKEWKAMRQASLASRNFEEYEDGDEEEEDEEDDELTAPVKSNGESDEPGNDEEVSNSRKRSRTDEEVKSGDAGGVQKKTRRRLVQGRKKREGSDDSDSETDKIALARSTISVVAKDVNGTKEELDGKKDEGSVGHDTKYVKKEGKLKGGKNASKGMSKDADGANGNRRTNLSPLSRIM